MFVFAVQRFILARCTLWSCVRLSVCHKSMQDD